MLLQFSEGLCNQSTETALPEEISLLRIHRFEVLEASRHSNGNFSADGRNG